MPKACRLGPGLRLFGGCRGSRPAYVRNDTGHKSLDFSAASCRPVLVQRVADTAAPIEQHRTRRAIDARAYPGGHPCGHLWMPQSTGAALHCARYVVHPPSIAVPLVAASAQFTGHSFTWPVHAFAARELLAAAAQVFKLPTVKLSMNRIVLDDLRPGVVGGLGDRLSNATGRRTLRLHPKTSVWPY